MGCFVFSKQRIVMGRIPEIRVFGSLNRVSIMRWTHDETRFSSYFLKRKFDKFLKWRSIRRCKTWKWRKISYIYFVFSSFEWWPENPIFEYPTRPITKTTFFFYHDRNRKNSRRENWPLFLHHVPVVQLDESKYIVAGSTIWDY